MDPSKARLGRLWPFSWLSGSLSPRRTRLVQEFRHSGNLLGFIVVLVIIIATFQALTPYLASFAPPQPRRIHAKHYDNSAKPAQMLACGSSPSEAQDNGCFFDKLNFAWQTPNCYDNVTVSEFMAFRDWNFVTDEQRSAVIPAAELPLDHRPVHVSWEFHQIHCMYSRRQLVRAVLQGQSIDSHLAAYQHTVHCGRTMLDYETALTSFHTTAPVIYPRCQALGVWKIDEGSHAHE